MGLNRPSSPDIVTGHRVFDEHRTLHRTSPVTDGKTAGQAPDMSPDITDRPEHRT